MGGWLVGWWVGFLFGWGGRWSVVMIDGSFRMESERIGGGECGVLYTRSCPVDGGDVRALTPPDPEPVPLPSPFHNPFVTSTRQG